MYSIFKFHFRKMTKVLVNLLSINILILLVPFIVKSNEQKFTSIIVIVFYLIAIIFSIRYELAVNTRRNDKLKKTIAKLVITLETSTKYKYVFSSNTEEINIPYENISYLKSAIYLLKLDDKKVDFKKELKELDIPCILKNLNIKKCKFNNFSNSYSKEKNIVYITKDHVEEKNTLKILENIIVTILNDQISFKGTRQEMCNRRLAIDLINEILNKV